MRSSLERRLAAEERISGWAAYGAVVYGVGLIAQELIELLQSSAWHRYFHAVHLAFTRVGTPGHQRLVLPHPPHGYYVGLFLWIPGLVYLVWQLRAAEVAQALGYPAKHSPGWGLGAWFVPVVNYWVPYGAMRDCLPPGHPARRGGWVPWVLFLSVGALQLGVLLALAELRALGVVLMLLSVFAATYVSVRAFGFVRAVHRDHQRAASIVRVHGYLAYPTSG